MMMMMQYTNNVVKAHKMQTKLNTSTNLDHMSHAK